jgi:hypothetical protein
MMVHVFIAIYRKFFGSGHANFDWNIILFFAWINSKVNFTKFFEGIDDGEKGYPKNCPSMGFET